MKKLIFSKKKIKTSIVVLFAMMNTLHAQSVANYNVTRSTGITYNSIISTGNSFGSWRYTGGFSEDDNRSEETNIGFDFWYNGTRYTKFSASTNGFMDFSASTDNGGPNCDDYGYCNFRFSGTTLASGTWLALAPFYDDMTTTQGTDPLGASIKYELSGTEPNRVLTVEWDGMAVYQNTTPDINFQVKIYETSGKIEFLYETMNPGTRFFSYTTGINAVALSGTPTAAELLTQQTANSTTFNNSPQNNLSTMPTANSQITFTPPATTAPTGLFFSAVTNKGMTLNWTDIATNEVGYVIYSSTDNINFYFNTQIPANSTSIALTPLSPSTTYYWKVHAITEGALSAPLTGNQATSAPNTIISNQSGDWDRTNTWIGGVIPDCGDNVIIQNGHNVRLESSGEECNDLTIGQGSSGILRIGRNTTALDLTIAGNLFIDNGGQMITNTASTATHSIDIKGNITNNGTFNMQSDANSLCNFNFSKIDGNQTISGTGNNTFHTFSINKLEKDNVLEVTANNFNCNADGLTIGDGGTFKFSSPGTNTFSLYNSPRDIPRNGKIWINSTSSIVSFNAGVTLQGDLTIDNGTVNVGNASNENIIYDGGLLEINDGNLNIAGRYEEIDNETRADFTMTGGIITVNTVGSTSTTDAPFSIDNAGAEYNVSGGTIIIEREGGTDLGFVNIGSGLSNVTGGTLQIGNNLTPAGQTMRINTTRDIGNLHINSGNATAQLITNNLSVLDNVTISSGTLNSGSLTLSFGGNWINTTGTHIPGTGTVILNGTNQSINNTVNLENFNNLTLDGSGIKTLSTNANINGNLIINNTLDIDAINNSTINLGGNFINNGTFEQQEGLVNLNGTISQQISGNNTTFYDIMLNNASGASIVSGNDSLINTMTLTSGTFNTNNSFTLISNISGTARIAEITGGSITGDITMQRYIIEGETNWRFLTSAVSGTTLADFNDDFITSGFSGSDAPLWPDPADPWESIYFYDQTLAAGIRDNGFVAATNVTNNLAVGEGLWVWCGDTITGTDPFTIDMTGPTNTGNINIPVSYTNNGVPDEDGWNMVGNPYPSTIDWDDPSIIKTGINAAIYIWDPQIGNYASYVSGSGLSVNGGSKDIASSQAFWVQTNASSPTLTVTEASKTADGGAFFKQSHPSHLTIEVINNNAKDQTIINFNANATANFDGQLDALKIATTATDVPSISTIGTDFTELSINQLAEQKINIPLKIITGVSGLHQINFKGISNFSNTACIIVEDLFTGNSYDLNNTSSFVAFINDTTSTARFLIKFGASTTISIDSVSCYGNNDGQILFEKNSPNPFDVIWKDNTGKILANNLGINSTDLISNLSAGTYILESTDNNCGNKIDTVIVNEPSEITAQFKSSADSIYLSNGGHISLENQSLNASYYNWNFDDTNTSTITSPTHQYTQAGRYLVTLNAFQNTNCFKSINKEIVVLNTITGIDQKQPLTENKAWIKNNQLIVDGKNIARIEVYNTAGQLIQFSNSKKDKQLISLHNLSSQILIISINSLDSISNSKINYIKN